MSPAQRAPRPRRPAVAPAPGPRLAALFANDGTLMASAHGGVWVQWHGKGGDRRQASRPTLAAALAAVAPDPAPPTPETAELDRLLAAALDGGGTLMVSAETDTYSPLEGLREFRVSAKAPGGRHRCASRETLVGAVQAALELEPRKKCNGCALVLVLGRFGRDRNNKDGRLRRCRRCEAARISAWEKRCEAARGGERRRTRG